MNSVAHTDEMEQAQVESLVWICGGILHIQHICSYVLGDTTCRFWCQYVTPHCCCFSCYLLLPCQVLLILFPLGCTIIMALGGWGVICLCICILSHGGKGDLLCVETKCV